MSFKLHPEYNHKLQKKDLQKVFLRSIPYEHSWNYERMGNVGYCFAMLPVLKKLYPDKEDLAKAMTRHLELYNVTPYIVTLPLGISAAMEEANTEVEGFEAEAISGVKTALMGPLSGVGDAFYWGTLRILATGIGISLAMQGNLLGPILFFLVFNIPQYVIRYICTFLGYRFGTTLISKVEESGIMSRVTRAASVMGLMVTGAMAAEMVAVNIPITIGIGEDVQTISELLGGIIPGLPALALFGVVYGLLKKKTGPLVIMLILLLLGIAGAFFGFLG